MTQLEEFLATVDVLHDLTPDERHRVSLLCRERSIAAGGRLLEQGGPNSSLFILRSGQLVVRARRDEGAETVAQLSPAAVVGEISFLTGRRCAADVDVAVDATIVELPRSSLTSEPECHDHIVRALSGIIAHRLHDTMARPVGRAVTPVVLVRSHPSWGAPRAFVAGLARALASATNADALLIGPGEPGEAPATRHTNEGYWVAGLDTSGGPAGYHRQLVEALPQWSGAFGSIVLTTGDATGSTHELVESFATHSVDLVGPASQPPEQSSPTHFVLQDARAPSLAPLTVHAHLVFDVAAAEQARDSGLPFPERFSRSVSSVARAITGTSVGLALGAGGARGWAHIGILEVLARERFPIDVVTGASMGAIVGGLLASGVSPFDLRRVMKEWHRRRRRLREMRFWRMHMASERGIEDLLRHFFGNRTVTTTEIPYAANAVDIESGEDVVIGSGLIRHAARASMAYPGWLPPYVKDGRVLVDGATLNPVPAGACRALGADFVIAVNVLGLNGASPLPQRWPRRQFEMMSRVFHLCTYAMSQMGSEAASDIVIMPNLGDATMLSFDRFDEMVDAGRRVAEEQYGDYRRLLAREGVGSSMTSDQRPARQSAVRRSAARGVAIVIVLSAYGLARIPTPGNAERAALAGRFHFTPIQIPDFPGTPARTVRQLHPSLSHVSAWFSSMGASVALNDLDGDALPNDACLVDPRSDRVIVMPAPGTGDRYRPFVVGEAESGATTAPTGCAPADMNEDGRIDLLVHYWGRTPIAFLRRANAAPLDAEGYQAVDVWPGGEIWNTNAVTFADLDGDGHPDMIVGNYFADGVRLLDAHATGSVPLPHSMSRAFNGGRDRLLLWDRATSGDTLSVKYRDVSNVLADEMLVGWTQAVGAADLDRDGLPEVYFTNDFGPDRLLHNRSTPGQVHLAELQGHWSWTTPPSKILGRDSFKGMGIDFGDVNGDGIPDLYVSNIAVPGVAVESHFLFASEGPVDVMRNGSAPYVDRSGPLGLARSGWAWDSKLADFDNDGVLEALQATGFIQGQIDRWPEVHELIMVSDEVMAGSAAWARFQPGDDVSGHEINPFFVRSPSGAYVDIARELHLEPTDTPYVTRGIAIADVDGDGDLDFFIANQWSPFVYYRNDAPRAGAFLGVRPFLVAGAAEGAVHRAAIGATVIVHMPDGHELVTTVDGGNGHTGRRSADAHIGLGRIDAGRSLPVEIIWRDASGRHSERLSLQPGWHNVDLREQGPATRP